MTRYDPRFCSKKRLQHLSIRDQAAPQKRSPSWYEVLQKTWARGWFLENQEERLTPEQREEMLCSVTRDGTQAIPVRFRSMRAQQLVDILAARRSVWVSEISLPKKLAKGLRKKILARRKDTWGSDYPAVARWVVR